jgi:hypothetical protein
MAFNRNFYKGATNGDIQNILDYKKYLVPNEKLGYLTTPPPEGLEHRNKYIETFQETKKDLVNSSNTSKYDRLRTIVYLLYKLCQAFIWKCFRYDYKFRSHSKSSN